MQDDDIVVSSRGYKYTKYKGNKKWAVLHGINSYGSETWELVKLFYLKKDQFCMGSPSGKKGDVIYPGHSKWGKFGWTFHSKEEALEEYEFAIKNNKKRNPNIRLYEKRQRE